MVKKIELTRGKYALVSNKDYEYFSQFKWYASRHRNKYYAARTEKINGKSKAIYMHREILKASDEHVDHIDGDSLNNVRENLRLVEPHQNLRNQKTQTRYKSSKFKGVYMDKELNTFVVQIKDRGRMRNITGIENEKIAGFIYDLLALDRFKEYARFNFPNEIAAWNTRAKA